MDDILKQYKKCTDAFYSKIHDHVVGEMIRFGMHIVSDVLPSQQEFRNLTGNTTTSFAFGVYYNGELEAMGFNSDKPALRNKLIKGESVIDFSDYDGSSRGYFKATVDTDGGYGKDSSAEFLRSSSPRGVFSMLFTTGTEYSAYLENVRDLNVMTDGFETVKSEFISSFKPIK